MPLLVDFVNGGELFTHLYLLGKFPEEHVRLYIAEITLALETLHQVSLYMCYVGLIIGTQSIAVRLVKL